MTNFKSVDEILDFAIKNEEEAADFYTDLATKVDWVGMKDVFEEFAAEEKKHKAKLLEIKAGKRMVNAEQKVLDLKMSDYLVDIEPTPQMDYQSALILAMKREKSAYKMYNHLAGLVDGDLQALFLSLAQEEAKHKLRFEVEYDDFILREN
jgi:rubrerythrin